MKEEMEKKLSIADREKQREVARIVKQEAEEKMRKEQEMMVRKMEATEMARAADRLLESKEDCRPHYIDRSLGVSWLPSSIR